MDCFDHGKEFVGLCGWCGKQVCPNCIGRTDGRKKYCHDCAAKMGSFQPKEKTDDRLRAHEEEKAKAAFAPTPQMHHEEPRIQPITAAKPALRTGHPEGKHIDPKVFELDDDEHFEPRRVISSTPKPAPVHTSAPLHSTTTARPMNSSLHTSSAPSAHSQSGQPTAARAAMSMFASSAMAQKTATTHSSAAPAHSSAAPMHSASAPMHSSAAPLHSATAAPARPSSAPPVVPKNAGSAAASKAFSFMLNNKEQKKE